MENKSKSEARARHTAKMKRWLEEAMQARAEGRLRPLSELPRIVFLDEIPAEPSPANVTVSDVVGYYLYGGRMYKVEYDSATETFVATDPAGGKILSAQVLRYGRKIETHTLGDP